MWKRVRQFSTKDWALILATLAINLLVPALVLSNPLEAEGYVALGYAGVFVSNLLSGIAPFSPIPAVVVTFIASAKLDFLPLIVVSALGVTLGEYPIFLVGDTVDKLIKGRRWHTWLTKRFEQAPFLFLVIWVAIPNFIQSFGVALAGTFNYPSWKYLLATFIGNCIWFVMVVLFGGEFFGR